VAWKTDWVHPPAPGAVIQGTPKAQNPLADAAAPIPGITVTLGAPSAGTSWTWSDGVSGQGFNETYVVYNPGSVPAEVRLALAINGGATEPFPLTVGPGQETTITAGKEARIVPLAHHSAILTSVNGVPVVAERLLTASRPAPQDGVAELQGGQVASTRWVLAGAPADKKHAAIVALYNPGRAPVNVSIDGLTGSVDPLPGIPPMTLPPGQQTFVVINHGRQALPQPLLVTASGPVFVEQDLYGEGGAPGMSLSLGVPLSS
jgi:hypothetical protein